MIPGVGLVTGSWRQACSLDPKLMWAGLKPATTVANLGKLEGNLSPVCTSWPGAGVGLASGSVETGLVLSLWGLA